MTLKELKNQIAQIVRRTWGSGLDLEKFDVSYTADPKFGDVATNAAMVYAKDLKRAPRELAGELAAAIKAGVKGLATVELAGPGFINMTWTDRVVGESAVSAPRVRPDHYAEQVVVTEYSDPNPFKVLHVGHLYTSIVGDAISNLVRLAGGSVHAVNFGGDVGLHVGRTLWAILKELGGEHPAGLAKISKAERSPWMAACYVAGTAAYEESEAAKAEIIELNKRIYAVHAENDHGSALAQIYWTCRGWSYDYFNEFYARIGTKFERYYPESETTPLGLAMVKEQLGKGVYKESQGAVVFEGESYGLHTRVFITSQGLPTYEAKDVGLIMAKWRDYAFDRSIIITGNDIIEYMKVVLKSIEQFEPKLVERTRHITHGNVKLAGGVKMSSRKGNFVTAVDVLEMAAEANNKANGQDDERVTLGAIKYGFLKQRIGADLIFIPEESVSLEGNSGPYLQYAHARARSILAKLKGDAAQDLSELDEAERGLALKISQYRDVLDQAVGELMPHYVCTYLYELAQVFNRFYEGSRVVGDVREGIRGKLVGLYAEVLRDGLAVLGIEAPDRL